MRPELHAGVQHVSSDLDCGEIGFSVQIIGGNALYPTNPVNWKAFARFVCPFKGKDYTAEEAEQMTAEPGPDGGCIWRSESSPWLAGRQVAAGHPGSDPQFLS
jgi:hypothetical protein